LVFSRGKNGEPRSERGFRSAEGMIGVRVEKVEDFCSGIRYGIGFSSVVGLIHSEDQKTELELIQIPIPQQTTGFSTRPNGSSRPSLVFFDSV
jgi:hypothetical protein